MSAPVEPQPRVGLYISSEVDMKSMQDTVDVLCDFAIPYEIHVMSAHATAGRVQQIAGSARERGLQVIIAAGGGAAHLPGMIASHTTLPVVGVPIATSNLAGLDALLSIAQIHRGVPVATVAVGGALNAALLAIQILSVSDPKLADALDGYRQLLQTNVSHMDARVRSQYRFKPKRHDDTTA